MDTSDHKKFLRAKCLTLRGKIDAHHANAAALALAARLLEAIPTKARTIAVYRPIRGEIDLAGALPELLERGHLLCLPIVVEENAPLAFRNWDMDKPLTKGHFGIEVPDDSAPLVEPDAVIVPLVAFDPTGHRLGYGTGFYDRTIHRLRQRGNGVHIIGAAFGVQQVEEIPTDAHDERLDAVVTEETIFRFA